MTKKTKPTIAAVVLAYNEAGILPDCLARLRWVDQLIGVDAGSSDQTREVFLRYTDQVHTVTNKLNVNVNKAYGIDRATTDWVIYIDADELVSPELASLIRKEIAAPDPAVAYNMPRRNFFFGHFMRYGGYYPDRQLRLFQRTKARFACRDIHEKLDVDGRVGRLAEPLDHITYRDISHYLRKIDFSSDFIAQRMLDEGISFGFWSSLRQLVVRPFGKALRRYFFMQGWREGVWGLFSVLMTAFGKVVIYGKCYHLHLLAQEAKKK